jgi:calcyclin binding protein
MVEIEEVVVEEEETPSIPASQERLLDAQEIENVASTLKRPTARMQLESLAKKLRKEAAALKVVEASHSKTGEPLQSRTSPSPAPVVVEPPKPVTKAAAPPVIAPSSTAKYTNIDRFSFDAAGHNDRFVTLYIPLPGVGEIPKEQVTCEFHKAAFDLIVRNVKGKSYRLFKEHLEKDIVPDKSKFIIKADKILIKLAKVKGEYGSYDFWSKLTDQKRKEKKSSNPAAGINDLMKEMYDSGDDKMRKMIGETMMKQREGSLDKSQDMGLGDLGAGFGDEDI